MTTPEATPRRFRPFRVSWWDARWNTDITRAYTKEADCRALARRVADDGAIDVRVWRVDEDGYVVGTIDKVRAALDEESQP